MEALGLLVIIKFLFLVITGPMVFRHKADPSHHHHHPRGERDGLSGGLE